MLEIYSLEIQVALARNESEKLKEITQKTKRLTASFSDPKIMAIIKETQGRILMM